MAKKKGSLRRRFPNFGRQLESGHTRANHGQRTSVVLGHSVGLGHTASSAVLLAFFEFFGRLTYVSEIQIFANGFRNSNLISEI